MARAADQSRLFDTGASLPNGLIYRPDFLTHGEEEELLRVLSELPLQNAVTDGYVAKRRIMNFGWSFDFDTQALHKGPPLPAFLAKVQRKVAKWLNIPASSIVEALINEYTPGTSLGWHRDNENFETIIGISLGSWSTIRFRPIPSLVRGRKRSVKDIISLDLEPRSAYVMQGDIRWKFQHSIPATRGLRYSITFRTLPASLQLPKS